MAIAFGASGGANTGNSTTVTVSFAAGASATVALISSGHFRDGTLSASSDNLSSVTVDGNAATLIAKASQIIAGTTNQTQWMHYYLSPPTGAVDYVTTFADTDAFSDEVIQTESFTGTATTAAVIDSSNILQAGQGNFTISTTVVGGGCWLVSNAGGNAPTAGTGTTRRQINAEMAMGDSNAEVSPGSQSMGWNQSGTGQGSYIKSVIVSIAPPAVAGGGRPRLLTLLGVT